EDGIRHRNVTGVQTCALPICAYDCGLHDMALLLKASELGLSTLVMGIRDAEKLREVLSVPAYEQIVSVIAVGYAAVDPERPARKIGRASCRARAEYARVGEAT